MKKFHENKFQLMSLVGFLAFFITTSMATSKNNQEEMHQYAELLPITISVECQVDTPKVDQTDIERAPNVNQLIRSVECIDRKKSIASIYPKTIGVVQRKSSGAWNLVLIISKNDAENIELLSKVSVGKFMLISVKNKVVAKAMLYGPIMGQRIYISMDSEKEGEAMAARFMDMQAHSAQ